MQNPFDQFDSAPAPVSRGPLLNPKIPEAPNPYQVQKDAAAEARALEDQRLQREAAAREQARFTSEQAERDQKASVTGGAKAKTAETLRNNLATIDRIIKDADDNGGWGETGASGAFMRALPVSGTAGYSLESELATLKANNAFTGLIALADQGIKLTPISNEEVKLAASSIANLDPNADHETFMRTLRGLRDKYNQTLAGLEGPSESDPQTAAQMTKWAGGVVAPQGGPAPGTPPRGPTGDVTFDMDTGTGAFGSEIKADRLTPQQQTALDAFLKANAGNPNFGPERLTAFYQSVGIQGGAMPGDDAFYNAVRSGNEFGTQPDYTASDEEAKRRALEASYEVVPEGGDVSTFGLDKGVTLNLSDELMGVAGGVRDTFSGGSFGQGYQRERDIERALQSRSREEAGIAPELTGSLLAPAGVFGTARTVRQFANQGAALGGVAGFGQGEGLSGSTSNALLGAGVGAAAGAAFSQAPGAVNALAQSGPGQRLTAMIRPRGEVNREVVEAGARQNIPVRQPDARPETRNALAVVEASPTQGARVKATLDADKAAVRSRLSEVSGDGTRLDNFSMGERIQAAGQREIVKTRAQANAMYGRATTLAGDTKVAPQQAIKAIDDNIAELTQAGPKGNAGAIKYLKDLRSDLARGDLSIDQLRSIRTNMRGQISERNLTATDAERRVGDVLRAASADIERGLAGNPQALGAYKSADKFYQEKQAFIKDVVQKFTGSRNNPLSAEQAATKFKAMMQNKGDYKRFSEMMKRLDPEERSDIAASIGESMGTARNGEFTLAALSSNVEKLNPRALRDLFGEDGAKAIADLRIIARAKADTANGLNNSKSGVVTAGTNQFKDVILGVVGGGIAGLPGAVAGMAARGGVERLSSARAARLLLNPDFTKWLRQTPNTTNPAVINRHFDRLNKIASREQAFLMDAKALQEFLAGQVSKGTGRAAAEDNTENDRGK